MSLLNSYVLPYRADFRPRPDGFIPKIDLVATTLPKHRTAYLEYGVTENPKILSLVKIITGRVGTSTLRGARFLSGKDAGLEWRVKGQKIAKSDEWASKNYIVTAPSNIHDCVDIFGQRVSTATNFMNSLRSERYKTLEEISDFEYGDIDEWVEYLEFSGAYLKTLRDGKTWSELALAIA